MGRACRGTVVTVHATEVYRGDRFEFGANLARFLSLVNADRITQAENMLRSMLAVSDLQGKRFLDVGSHDVPNWRASVLAGHMEDRS